METGDIKVGRGPRAGVGAGAVAVADVMTVLVLGATVWDDAGRSGDWWQGSS